MTTIKVGDKVTRTTQDWHDVYVGRTYTVGAFPAAGCVTLVGVRGTYMLALFEPCLDLAELDALMASPAESDPHGKSMKDPGAKADAGKLRPTLVLRDMSRALLAVIKIATDGAAKYTDGGWILVPNGLERYEDAALRHMLTRFSGQPVDAMSGEPHLAHEAWNALAKLDLYLREKEAQ